MVRRALTEKEETIFHAAMDEFLEKGVHGSRMQSIADRAGVNKALVHYYFRSKDQLYERVLEEITIPFWRELNHKIEVLEPDDFEGAVRVIATHVVDSAIEMPHSAILLSEFASGGQFIKDMDSVASQASAETAAVLKFFASLVERKVILPYNPLNIFVSILGMCWNIFLSEPFSTPVLEEMGIVRDERFYQEYVDLIVKMTTSGLARG